MQTLKPSNLDHRENYLRTLEFRNPDWIPVQVDLITSVWLKYGETLEDVVIRHPLVFPHYKPGSFPKAPRDPFEKVYDSLVDDWGCVWRNTAPGQLGQVIGHPLSDWKDFRHFRPPNPREQFDWQRIREKVLHDRECHRLTTGYMSITQGGFFDRLQFLRGMENLMMDFALQPPELDSLINMVLEYNLLYNKLYLDMGLDLFYFHGDIGSQNGLLFSPATFRKYLKPAYEEMFLGCRRAGAHVFYSSDGYMLSVVEDMMDCGISMHDPEIRTNTLEGIRQAYFSPDRTRKMCASVQLDTQMLPSWTPGEIHRQVAEVTAARNPSGGMMLYMYVSADVPLGNIEALCCAIEQHCF